MMLKLTLTPLSSLYNATDVEWDPDTGALGGAAADEVRGLVAAALDAGTVTGHPYPTQHAISRDPLRDRALFAVVIGQRWCVPDALADDYPAPPDEGGNDDLELTR